MSAATMTRADAGRTSRNHSPWTSPTAAASPRFVRYIRVRTTSVRAKPASASALDDLEGRPRLAGGVTGMLRASVGPGVGRARDVARVAGDDRAAVAVARLPRAAAGDPAPRVGAVGAAVAHDGAGVVRQLATSGSRDTSSRSAARSVVRGTIESTSRYSSGE